MGLRQERVVLGKRELLAMADIMQTPQGPDDRGSPVQPVVAGSANQTNARTGGMVATVQRPMVNGRPDMHAPAGAPPIADPAQAAVAQVRAMIQGSPMPNVSPAAQAQLDPMPTFGVPTTADQGKTWLAHLYGIGPQHTPDGQAAIAAAPAAAAASQPQDPSQQQQQQHLHALGNPHLYTDDDYVKMFAGKPWGYVKQLFSALQPPSMQEQAMRSSLAETYKPGSESEAAKLLQWYGLGPNALTYSGMQKRPGQ